MHEIDLRRIDLNLLVVFDVLMRERSVTRAAASLARTQSAVSHALARLREQLGDPLLVKVGGRMTPSPRAEQLADEVRGMLAGIRRMLAAPAPFDPATSTRIFRVAFPDVTMSWFARLATAVYRAGPGVRLEWVVRDDRTPLAVAEGRVDLALFPAAMDLPEGVQAEAAGAFRWATFARTGHPATARWGRAAWRRHGHVVVRVSDGLHSPIESAGPGARDRYIAAWVPHFSAVAPLLATTDLLAKTCDFFSIGTNDLIQYLLAIDRGNDRVAHLYEPAHPAVVRTLKHIVDEAHRAGVPVSVCGEMAGDPIYVPLLLGLGVDALSMTPPSLPAVKYLVRGMTMADARALAVEVLALGSAQEIHAKCAAFAHARISQT